MVNLKMIEFSTVSKLYNKTSGVKDVSFNVKSGEVFALCGGNGAGKSTVIKLMTGILQPDRGSIKVNGQDKNENEFAYKEMFSFMPDEMVFPPQLTGQETLRFFARLRNISNERVEAILKQVGLFDVRNQIIKQCSKGMQQRLALAQALLPDASFLILDEPTNGLDPYWVYKFKELILSEKEKGKTIIFTTHILSLVEDIADRAAFMEEGKLILCENVQTLIQQNGQYVPLEKVFFEHHIK